MDYIIYKGNKYKRTKEGYYLRTERLHRRIWEDHFGEIPSKHHIHHKNGIKSDNRIENLECISERDHPHQHFDWKEQIKVLHRAREEANKWHKSKLGRRWHSENSRLAYARRNPIEKVCVICSAQFMTKNLAGTKYCSQRCRSKSQYLRDQIQIECVICQSNFKTFKKKNHSQACSPGCSTILAWRTKKGTKNDFIPTT